MLRTLISVLIVLSSAHDAQAEDHSVPAAPPKSPTDVIPITMANLRGHEALYREGWFVVSSTDKALRYAHDHGVTATGQAMAKLQQDLAVDTQNLGKDLAQAGRAGVRTTTTQFTEGTQRSQRILGGTQALAEETWKIGAESMQKAWHTFIRGNLSLVQRTEEDRAALTALPGDYFKTLSADFHNLFALSHAAKASLATRIEGRWSDAYREAAQDYTTAYEKSGTRANSLLALGDILAGYLKVVYSGLVKPATRSTVQVGEAATKTAAELIFLPTASLFIVSGRTVQSIGMSLYYATSMGVSVISPTVEGGLLAGWAMLSYGATPVVYATGGTLGAVNQIAVTAGSPVLGAGHAVAVGGAGALEYAAMVGVDAVNGTAKVSFHQVSSGVALGYNALTALPTQMALGVANSVVFLAWDGPRLVLASAKGEVRWRDDHREHALPVQSLPVGSVVDLQALGAAPGVEVQTLTSDPELIGRVLEKLPQDLRVEQPQ